jgi:hypothetical protein
MSDLFLVSLRGGTRLILPVSAARANQLSGWRAFALVNLGAVG